MEKEENGLVVNIEHYTGEKPIEVIYRIGAASKAQESLPTREPVKVNVSGVISTPCDWLEKRIELVDQKRAHVLVNRETMTITLTVNEDDEYTKGVLKGTVELSDIFRRFNINGDKGWTPNKLGQFLRLNRAVFADKEQCMLLVTKLKNFTAKAKTEIQKQRDPSGSMAEVYRVEVESGLPKSFTVVLPIFKGTAKTPIEVEFDHYLMDGEVYLQLVSPGANECVEQFRDSCLDEVINKIKHIAPNIPILEV